MKTSVVLLALSLLGNGMMVVAWQSRAAATQAMPPAPASATTPIHPSSQSGTKIAPAPTDATGRGLWQQLQTRDLAEFDRRLRSAGFPPRAVRALLGMAITEQFNERLEALVGRADEVPYWKNPSQNPTDPAAQSELRRLYLEREELNYRYLEGPAALVDNEDGLIAAQRRFGKLPLAKLQQAMAAQHDFEQLRREALGQGGEAQDAAGRQARFEAIKALEQAHRAEMAGILTPEEFEQYDLRTNGDSLRYSLATLRPTETEFKALHALSKQQQSAPSRDAWLQQVGAALGEERFAEFAVLQTTDGRGNLGQLIARLDLPLTTIPTVNGVRDDIRKRAGAISADATLSIAQRNEALAALATEANTKLTAALGPRGYEAYVDLKGDWIRALKPTP